jgi:hypothetical protein
MPGYKYPNIDSGGYSHQKRWSHTRQKDNFKKEFDKKEMNKKKIRAYD